MSLEAKVTLLEDKFEHLDEAFHENNKIVEATHSATSLTLNEQREKFRQLENEQRERLHKLEKENNKRFNTIEELLIPIVNNLASN